MFFGGNFLLFLRRILVLILFIGLNLSCDSHSQKNRATKQKQNSNSIPSLFSDEKIPDTGTDTDTDTDTDTLAPEDLPPAIDLIVSSQSYQAPAIIPLTAISLAQTGAEITKVEFFRNDFKVGESLTAPFTFTNTFVPAGTQRYTAIAHDNRGLFTVSSTQTVSVSSPPSPTCPENSTRTCSYSVCSGIQTCTNNAWSACELDPLSLTFLSNQSYYNLSTCAQPSDLNKIHNAYINSTLLSTQLRLARVTDVLVEKMSSIPSTNINIFESFLGIFNQSTNRDELRVLASVLSKAGRKLGSSNLNLKNDIINKLKDKVIQNKNLDTNTRAILSDNIHRMGALATLQQVLQSENSSTTKSHELIYVLQWLIQRNLNRSYTQTPAFVTGYPSGTHTYLEGYFDGQRYLIYIPTGNHSQYKVLFSIHGTAGTAEDYMARIFNNTCPISICPMRSQYSKNYMDQNGIVVIAPYFDIATFPNYDFFMNAEPGDKRSDVWMLGLLDSVSSIFPSGKLKTDKFYLWGHSKGGQFATAFTMNYPNRIIKSAAAASGIYIHSYNSPSLFVQNSPHPISPKLSDFLKTPYSIIVGTNDTAETTNPHRRKTKAIKFMCERLLLPSLGCSINPSFNCNRSNYISEESLNYHSNTPACKTSFSWVLNGIHNGHHTYPHSAQYLFQP